MKETEAAEAEVKDGESMDAPSDRFCDVVMEGGVTSGIIYAAAVVELARHYRFKSIGGSSIGAFAAALTAAAEYRRRHGSGDGFDRLAKVPEDLAKEEDGRTRLERLFLPQRGTRRLFRIFVAMLERSGPVSTFVFGLKAALWQYAWHIGLCVALGFGIVLTGPVLLAPSIAWFAAALLTLAVSVVVGIAVGLTWDFGRGVVRNGFGLCRGWDPDQPHVQDLAAFLHTSIQHVAGRDPRDPKLMPLTFRDLWDAPGSPGRALGFEARGAGAHSIDLEVYTSNLSHSRPYRFPLDEDEDMGRLFFRLEELERYFPKGIVQYLAACSRPYKPRSDADPPARNVEAGYLELPAADLPIVVAARLAMSFPLLISAVPLHAINHERQRLDRCWMSDGGLCSNFPIHLFDSFLPMWPTFGISLNSRSADMAGPVWLPEFHTSGRGETWDHGPDKAPWRLGSFLVSVWKTTWRWNDSTMMRMPGVRDRVVRIYLARGEGGVNIRMPGPRIQMLGKVYGTPAAQEFIRKFGSELSRGWQEHRWVRLNCLLISLRERLHNFGKAAAMDHHTTPFARQLFAALASAPLRKPARRAKCWPSEDSLELAEVTELWRLVAALRGLEQAFEDAGDNEPYRAVPRPSLRMRHPT
jgi:predicted acylesterase/phospholipase RssA